MNRLLTALTLFAALAAARDGEATEEHFDVFVGISGSQTAYGGIDVDEGDITLNQRVFETEMGELIDIFIADEPGFNHPENDALLPPGVDSLQQGDELFVRKLPLTVDGASAELFVWDGVGAPSFTPAGGVAFDIVTPGANQSIGMAGAGGGFDDHPLFELSAGGAVPTPGIYLGSFEVQVEALEPSDALFLVMGTEGLVDTDEELEALIEVAVEYVETNVVPEPGAATLVALVFTAFPWRQQRLRQ